MSYMKRYLEDCLSKLDEEHGFSPGTSWLVWTACGGDLEKVEELIKGDRKLFLIYSMKGLLDIELGYV